MYHKWYDTWFLEYWARETKFFVILDHFLPFYLGNNPKNQNFEKKWKKKINTRRYYHFTHVCHKCQSYDLWFLRYGVWWTKLVVILDHFLHLYPPNNPKNQNFEKTKKPPRDIITLHICIINDNHIMYGPWDMECERHNFLTFWTVFCPFTPPTTRKIKILKK